jgi:Immunoglobulin-like domain of bacterial spore germination
MLKNICLLLLSFLSACTGNGTRDETQNVDSIDNAIDSSEKLGEPPPSLTKKYSNTRFRNVTVTKSAESTYTIQGEGQIFEANFGWVVEDGHNELKQGFQMTDAGAPEWGKFKFTVMVEKQQPNSTLTLILFETSAKDGSRQYELPVVLE